MEDTLRYFFSAVFQGMAAVITIGAVFVVFKLEDVNSTLGERLGALLDRIRGHIKSYDSSFSLIFGEERLSDIKPGALKSIQKKILDEYYQVMNHIANGNFEALDKEKRNRYDANKQNKIEMKLKESWNHLKDHYHKYYNVEKSRRKLIKMIAIPTLLSIAIMVLSLVGLLLLEWINETYLFGFAIFLTVFILIDFILILRSVYKTLNFMEE